VTETPDLTSYYLIHDTMRRAGDQLATAIWELTEDDHRRTEAIRWYTDGFLGELHAHHTIEDDLVFPALAAKVPTFADYQASLSDDHVHLSEVMEALGTAVRALAGGGDWKLNHRVAVEQSAELARFLHDHLGVEDDDILPMFTRHFTVPEYKQLDDEAIKRTGFRQLLFTVPWIVTTGDAEQVRSLFADAPLIITVVWRLMRRSHARRASLVLATRVPAVIR
jgi:hemerythrin-like domain-containing protein